MGWRLTASLGIALAILVTTFNGLYQLLQTRELVQESRATASLGAQSHRALCIFRADLVKRKDDNVAFLRLTVDQRVAKYGDALGHIPEAVIEQSLTNQVKTIRSLSALNCD